MLSKPKNKIFKPAVCAGKFLFATNWVYRDHWILFSDYLFQLNSVIDEEERVDLEIRVFIKCIPISHSRLS